MGICSSKKAAEAVVETFTAPTAGLFDFGIVAVADRLSSKAGRWNRSAQQQAITG